MLTLRALAFACATSFVQAQAQVPAPPAIQPAPPPGMSQGELLYTTHCIACHTTEVHWRDKKLAKDWRTLIAQVRRWQENSKLELGRRGSRRGRALPQRQLLSLPGARGEEDRRCEGRQARGAQGLTKRLATPKTRIMPAVADYLSPDLPPGLRRVVMPVVDATPAALDGYGHLVDDPTALQRSRSCAGRRRAGGRSIPTPATRAARREGTFVSEWKGDILYGRNDAVGGHYILAYAAEPAARRPQRTAAIRCAFCSGTPTTIRTAASSSFRSTRSRSWCRWRCPATTCSPQDFVCFRFDGRCGLYIHPDIWHEGVFATARHAALLRQAGRRARARLGRLRARVRLPAGSADRMSWIVCAPPPSRRFARHRREPRLLLTRQSGRAVVVRQQDEARVRQIALPRFEVMVGTVAAAIPAFSRCRRADWS